MTESGRLAQELDKALNGEAWHGPSWRELLADLTGAAARARPLDQGHSIAEILAHSTAWLEVVTLRLSGESPTVSDAEDWPSAPADDASYSVLCVRFQAAGAKLVDAVKRFPPRRLHQSRPGLDSTWYMLISGELQHLLYHAGQVGLLRRAA